jgi:predicted ATP-grasp superfamily ATP-dependent carboligase
VNPRIGCTFRLFAATNGMDVARSLYLSLTGQPVTSSHAKEGRKWMVEDFDLFSAFRSWRGCAITIKDWASSLRGVEEAACFALDDPLPFLLIAVADCCELYRWIRRQAAIRTREPLKSPKRIVPPDLVPRKASFRE